MAERLILTDEERRERRREQNRQCYKRHAEERIAQVSERRRERKRENPDYKPRVERVTPPEVLDARRLKKLARSKAYYEQHKAQINQRGTERNRNRRTTDEEFRERSREYTRKHRAKDPATVNAKARAAAKARRATPEGAEANRRQCQKYRAEHRDELLPKQRAKHYANREENNATRKQHYYEHREENRPVRARKLHQTRQSAPWKFALNSARRRAKKKGVPFDLTAPFLEGIWTGRCAVSGLGFRVGKGSGPSSRSPSLDRIDPKLGYVPGNVRFVLWAVNALKAEATDADMYEVAEAILVFRKTSQKQILTDSEGAARDV